MLSHASHLRLEDADIAGFSHLPTALDGRYSVKNCSSLSPCPRQIGFDAGRVSLGGSELD